MSKLAVGFGVAAAVLTLLTVFIVWRYLRPLCGDTFAHYPAYTREILIPRNDSYFVLIHIRL